MPRAVIYTRVSSGDQVRNTSLATQLRNCEEWCERNGYDVDRAFVEEGASAKTTQRIQFQAMMAYCRKNKGRVAVVVVNFVDRLGRNTMDNAITMAELLGLGIAVRSVTEPINESPEGKLFATIFSGVAEFDNDRRTQKTVSGMKESLARGRWTFKAPLGYLNRRDPSGNPTLEPDPERAPLVREAFRLFATGRYTRRRVLEVVSSKGLRTASGRLVSIQTFSMMLRNRIYVGEIGVKGWGERHTAAFAPLIRRNVFERAQAQLTGKRESVAPYLRNNPDFPLRVFVRCGKCARPLTASWSTGRAGRKYGYYRCPVRACRRVNEKKETFEDRFIEFLDGLVPKREYLKVFREVILDVWNSKQAASIEKTRRLQRKLDSLRADKSKLFDWFFQGKIDEKEYAEAKDRTDERISLTHSEMASEKMLEVDVEAVVRFGERLMLQPGTFWRRAKLDQRQRLQRLLFPKGLSYDSGQFGTAGSHSIFDLCAALGGQKEGLVAPTGIEPVL